MGEYVIGDEVGVLPGCKELEVEILLNSLHEFECTCEGDDIKPLIASFFNAS
jgi:hypothetical protein